MTCTRCQRKYDDDVNYCPICGQIQPKKAYGKKIIEWLWGSVFIMLLYIWWID